MTKTRWIAVAAAVAVLAIGGVAYGVTSGGSSDDSAAPSSTTTSTVRPTTTTSESTTTTTSTSTTSTIPLEDGVLQRGDKSAAVEALQRRLIELHFDPGPADGSFGLATLYAVQGFQKLAGMGPDGKVGAAVQAALANPPAVIPLVPNGGATRVEVALKRQLLFLYKDGELRLISHVSTGSGKTYCVKGDCDNRAITPIGSFRFAWRYSGWRESRLGKLYNPVYFTSSGVAVHGALSVPTYPASHGCVRIPMHIAEYFPSLVKRGDPVYVTDGRPVGPPSTTPTGPPPSDPPTTPGDDDPSTTTTTAPPSTTTTVVPTTTSTTPTTLIP
ncbi:MAG: Peptidoglycan-binding domain 1 protein [Actinomycetia bacterium]|nr:Peptidoglycan-binding domain 1 protein [Actinomycetes bacterium]